MEQKLIIVDDFYEDPDAVRTYALNTEYKALQGHTYPGENSVEGLMLPGQREVFKQILGRDIELTEIGLRGHFRISKGSDSFEQDIHVDPPTRPDEMVWAAVIYLNTKEQCTREDGSTRDGTLFWKHKELDIERVPMSREEGQALGFKDYDAVSEKLIYQDGHDRSRWELMYRVPMKYNRIVFFRPTLWHSHGENFGEDRENARLVQIFFFRKGGTLNYR